MGPTYFQRLPTWLVRPSGCFQPQRGFVVKTTRPFSQYNELGLKITQRHSPRIDAYDVLRCNRNSCTIVLWKEIEFDAFISSSMNSDDDERRASPET